MEASPTGSPAAEAQRRGHGSGGTPSFYVTVEQVDADGNYTREKLGLNDAVLSLLRFARRHPNALCTIELREVDPVGSGFAPGDGPIRIRPIWQTTPDVASIEGRKADPE